MKDIRGMKISERSCESCIYLSCWQPKEKEMRKPIEFENKDSFTEFITQYELCRTNTVSQIIEILEKENHITIKRNPVEEAEEILNHNLTHNTEYIPLEKQRKLYDVIQRFKKQLEEKR